MCGKVASAYKEMEKHYKANYDMEVNRAEIDKIDAVVSEKSGSGGAGAGSNSTNSGWY